MRVTTPVFARVINSILVVFGCNDSNYNSSWFILIQVTTDDLLEPSRLAPFLAEETNTTVVFFLFFLTMFLVFGCQALNGRDLAVLSLVLMTPPFTSVT